MMAMRCSFCLNATSAVRSLSAGKSFEAHTWPWAFSRVSRKRLGEDVFYSRNPSRFRDRLAGRSRMRSLNRNRDARCD